MDKYTYIANAHGDYIDELYKAYQQDPESVDFGWRKFFEGFEFSAAYGENGHETAEAIGAAPAKGAVAGGVSDKEVAVRNLIHAYRTRGHLRSKTNPVRDRKDRKAHLDLTDFGLSEKDLDTVFQVGEEIGIGAATLRDIECALKKIYEGSIGFEYMYIRDPEVLAWFKQKVERDSLNFNPGIEYKKLKMPASSYVYTSSVKQLYLLVDAYISEV